MTVPIQPSFYADPAALAGLKKDARAQDPAALQEAARQFESLFTKMLLKSMREASESFGDSLFSSEQTQFYQGMFDDQLAVSLSQGKGLGLAEVLVRQLTQAGLAGPANTPDGERASDISHTAAVTRAGKHTVYSSLSAIASPAEFVQRMRPHAETAARALGVDPDALLAQAALETGWGKSVPCTANGDCSFNFFGIKAGSSWNGPTVAVPTLEFEDGVGVKRVERFRAYDSPAASFQDYAALIRNNSRYQAALGAGSDIAAFASALQSGGYATDPNYADKITRVAERVRELTDTSAFKSAAMRPSTHNGGSG